MTESAHQKVYVIASPPRSGSLNNTRPQPGDGVSAFLCNFLDDHGVTLVKVLKTTGLRPETQSTKLNGTAVMPYTYCTWPLSASCPKHFILTVRLPLTPMLLTSIIS